MAPCFTLLSHHVSSLITSNASTRTPASQTATIYLGAASTITAGLLTYFKSRNQPNRARQLRQALRSVRNNMDDQSRELAGMTPEQAQDGAHRIIKQYNDALAEAAANYPDLWVTLADLRKFLPGNNPVDGQNDQRSDTTGSGDGSEPNQHGTNASSPSKKPPQQGETHSGSSETHAADPDAQAATPKHGDIPPAKTPVPPKAPASPSSQTKVPPSEPVKPTAPGDKTPSNPPPRAHSPQITPELTPSEKGVRDIADGINLDDDFSHPDDGAQRDSDGHNTKTAAPVAAATTPTAPPAVQSPPGHVAAPVGLRRVGGFVLLE